MQYIYIEQPGYTRRVSCFDRIWEAGILLDETKRLNLHESLASLRRVNNIGLSALLVDPFRHAVIFSRTRTKSGAVVDPPITNDYSLSTRFAALPTDVRVSEDGKSTCIRSYINGINPHFSAVYAELSNLLSHTIPIFANVLTDLHRNNPLRQRITGTFGYAEWDEPDPPEDSDDEEGWESYDKEMAHWIATRPIVLPDVTGEAFHVDLTARRHVVCLDGKDIQVLIRVTDVLLVSDNVPNKRSVELLC
jgi:hypothetical protein